MTRISGTLQVLTFPLQFFRTYPRICQYQKCFAYVSGRRGVSSRQCRSECPQRPVSREASHGRPYTACQCPAPVSQTGSASTLPCGESIIKCLDPVARILMSRPSQGIHGQRGHTWILYPGIRQAPASQNRSGRHRPVHTAACPC